MKTIKYLSLRVFAVTALALVFALPTKAQMTDNGYANIDWQYNFPLSNNFADKSSGWGMNFEGGYFLTDNFALGAFLNYHSNHEYFGRQTLPVGEGGSLNTDQQHTAFQLPFGLASRYVWNRGGAFQPYAGVKLGAEYAQLKSTSTYSKPTKIHGVSMYLLKLVSMCILGLMDRACISQPITATVRTKVTSLRTA